MISIRKAVDADYEKLLKLIQDISKIEKEYLRYDQESGTVTARLLKNINDDHVVVFTDNEEVFGFLEYTVESHSLVWVYSLYQKKEYRAYTFELVLPLFNALRKAYQLPVHFTVDDRNVRMIRIAKFIKAEPITTYGDGRIEYRLTEVSPHV